MADNIKITAFQKSTKLAFICLKTDFQNWENDKPFLPAVKGVVLSCVTTFGKWFFKPTHKMIYKNISELLFFHAIAQSLNMIDCFDIFSSSPPYETVCSSNVVYNLIFDPL